MHIAERMPDDAEPIAQRVERRRRTGINEQQTVRRLNNSRRNQSGCPLEVEVEIAKIRRDRVHRICSG